MWKMMKYDYPRMMHAVWGFCALAVVLSALSRLLSLADGMLLQILSGITGGIAIGLCIGGLICAVLGSWERFIQCVYKDESSLRHSLPVKRSDIYGSLVFSGILTVLSALAGTVVSILILFRDHLDDLQSMLFSGTGMHTGFLWLILGTIAVELIYILLVGYVGIILGYRRNSDKKLFSLFYGLAVYFALAILLIAVMACWAALSEPIRQALTSTSSIPFSVLQQVVCVITLIYLAACILFYSWGEKMVAGGVNTD